MTKRWRASAAILVATLAITFTCDGAHASRSRRGRPRPAAPAEEEPPLPSGTPRRGLSGAKGQPPEPAVSPAADVPPAVPPMPVGEVVHTVVTRGLLLENLTWVEAESYLKPTTVVVIPLGAQSKEHGPHLRLKNDWLIAEYLKRRVLEEADVVVAPTIPYSFYPAFTEYPGSTSLRLETARDTVVDICRGLSRFGPRRFYVLNTGISTLRALAPAAELLAKDGVLLRYTDTRKLMGDVEKQVRRQPGGSHADEIETSMMLYIAPESVDMTRAARDYDAVGEGPLTRVKGGPGTYSPTGIWGDATLATRDKGARVVEALVAGILRELADLAKAEPPASQPAAR